MKPNQPPRYLLWSPKAIAFISIPVVLITALLVFWLSSRSIFVELQITLSLIALGLFIFLAVGLYRGVRLEKPGKADLPEPSGFDAAAIFTPTGDLPKVDIDVPSLPDSGDDLVGCLVSIVFWLVVSVVIVALLWLIQQFIILTLPALVVLLYWIFYRALRVVFSKSRVCRNKLWLSLGYSFLYTFLYTGWLFGLVWIGQFVIYQLTPR